MSEGREIPTGFATSINTTSTGYISSPDTFTGPLPLYTTGTAYQAPVSNQIRPINITQVNHGYIVVIGCQTIVIETKERLIEKLAEYINDPAGTENKYNSKELL